MKLHIRASDPLPRLMRQLHEELMAEYAEKGLDIAEDEELELTKAMMDNYWYDCRRQGLKLHPSIQRALISWNDLPTEVQLDKIQKALRGEL